MIPWFQQTVWHIGPIPIQVWGFFVALGMMLSLFIIWKRGRQQGMNGELLLDAAIWMIVGGFIGARIFHIALYEPAFYFTHPLDMLKVWQGGLSSFGGLAGAVAAFFFFYKKKKNLLIFKSSNLLSVIDLFAYSALFGWIIGRLGCVMIHDHLGRPCDCFLAIQMPDGMKRLEMAMLEILGLLPLAVLFFFLRKKKLPAGWFTSVLFVYYGILRFMLDFFRATDIPGSDARYLGLTPGQYSAILMVAFGGYIFIKNRNKNYSGGA